MKIRPTSLPLQLLILVVLPLLGLLLIIALGGTALHQAAMRDMLVSHNAQVVAGAATSLSHQLAQRREVLAALQLPAGDRQELQEALRAMRWLPALFDGGVAVFTEDGDVLAAVPNGAQWQTMASLISGSSSPAFIPQVEPGQNDTRIVVLASAGDLRVAGVVSLTALPVGTVLQSLHESSTTAVYLMDGAGQVLYHSDPAYVGQQFAIPVSDSEPVERPDRQGQDVVATAATVPVARWTLIQEERWQEALSPLMRYSQAAPLVLVPGLLIAMGAMWFGVRRIVVPLRRLEAQATAVAGGDFGAIEQRVGGIREIQHLQTTLQDMARRVQAAQVSMHDYIGAITQAQEDERRRLARELHDQTAQSLVALGHRQQMLKPYLTNDARAAELQAEIRQMIQDTLEDLRRIVRALRPVYLEELGLVPALQMLARDLGEDGKTTIHFEKTGTPQRLTPEHEIALYRIAQEALNNAWRHSGAGHIWLKVQFAERLVTISVRDNGRGFSLEHQAETGSPGTTKHFGIMGMYERAALIGARLHIQSEPGTGTTVTVQAPIAPTTADA
ncbi:MAG: hypothetical protein Kow00106_17000 [Anaerolineae bacterium]